MSRDRYYFGDIISHTPEGPIVDRMAMVIQRRQSMDRKRKYVFQLIGCPYCGELHTHSDGTGYRVPHCPDRKPGSGEYRIMETNQPVLPPNAPYPGKKRGPRKTWN